MTHALSEENLFELLDVWREGLIEHEQFVELQGALEQSPAARSSYVEYMHADAALYLRFDADCAARATALGTELAERAVADSDAFPPAALGDDALRHLSNRPSGDGGSSKNAHRRLPANAILGRSVYSSSLLVAVLVLLVGLAIMAIVRIDYRGAKNVPVALTPQATAARVVNLADCRWDAAAKRRTVGESLAAGERIDLQSGYIELEFESGATILLKGPARCAVESTNESRLLLGSLTAKTPPRARGFTVHTPSAKVIDLGTEFGVWVDEAGDTEVHVFSGTVLSESIDGISAKSSLELTANQAARLSARREPARMASRPAEFVRRMPARMRLPVYGTGQKTQDGNDLHWKIVSVSGKPDFSPQPAKVARTHNRYASPNNFSCWIARTTDADADEPADCAMTFRATFDLAECDPATARLWGTYAADNRVVAIRLNGEAVIALQLGEEENEYDRRKKFAIEQGFRPGVNELEFVVENLSDVPDQDKQNPMGLMVELHGSALRIERFDE